MLLVYYIFSPYVIQTKLFSGCGLCLNSTYRGFIFQLIVVATVRCLKIEQGAQASGWMKQTLNYKEVKKKKIFFPE